MAIGALSLVIEVWCGISRSCSRRSTLRPCSMNGMSSTRPGPPRAAPPPPPAKPPFASWLEEGKEHPRAGAAGADAAAQPEDHQPLVLLHDPDGAGEDQKRQDQNGAGEAEAGDGELRLKLRCQERGRVHEFPS